VPKDPKLPGGGGYTLTYEEIAPAKFNQYDNLYTLADNAGGIINRYNGVDGSVNARLQQGLTVQAGFSTGNVIEDECGLAAQHPDVYISSIGSLGGGSLGFGSPFIGGIAQIPQSFCHRESGWQTNYKGLASYNVPKIDVVVSGTFHSLPYPGSNFPSIINQSLGGQAFLLFPETSLGRPFSGVDAVQFFNVVKPGTVYGDRLNGLDLRLGKILKYGRTKALVSVDIFNVTNSNAIDVYQQTYGPTILTPQSTYLNPLSITQARFFKISAQFDF
jgi:hypothetical protein